MKVLKVLRDSKDLDEKEKFWDILSLMKVRHEHIISIEAIFYYEDDESNDLCFTMPIAWHGDLN